MGSPVNFRRATPFFCFTGELGSLFSLARSFYDYWEIVAGGGLGLALLSVIICTSLASPSEAWGETNPDYNLFGITLDTGKSVSIDSISAADCNSGCSGSVTFKYKKISYLLVMDVSSYGDTSQYGSGRATVYFSDGLTVAKQLGVFTCQAGSVGATARSWVQCDGPTEKISLPEPKKDAILKFIANGGENPPTVMKDSGTTGSKIFKLTGQTPDRSHWTFLGWNTDDKATEASVSKTGSVTVPYGSTVTLYAIWKNYYPAIKGADAITIQAGSLFDPNVGVTATDPEDGNVTGSMSVTGTLDTWTPGSYELTYTAQDALGYKTTVKRTIIGQQAALTSMPQTGLTDSSLLVVLMSCMLATVSLAIRLKLGS